MRLTSRQRRKRLHMVSQQLLGTDVAGMVYRARQARMRQYEQRFSVTESGAERYIHPRGFGEYLPIHAFADEPHHLMRLGLVATDCKMVDAYWKYQDDILFLSVCTMAVIRGSEHPHVRWQVQRNGRVSGTIVVQARWITRAVFEAVLEQFARLGLHQPQAKQGVCSLMMLFKE